MIKARIRGIYSQSLTQIMLQNHFEIVQPTPDIARRFGLPVRGDIPDLDIWDRSDLQGIVAIAYESILAKLVGVLRRRLGDVIVRSPRVAKSSIYKGLVIGIDEKTGHLKVDLGETIGLLPERGLKRGDEIMVQVRAHDYGRKAPVLSSSITIPGRTAVLLPEPVVRLSTKIKDGERRRQLLALGRKIREHTDNWGILWRTAAENLTDEILQDEIDDLLDTVQQINTTFEKLEQPGLLFEGTSNADIEFPSEVKDALDTVREKIRPTIRRHHFYKSAGYSALVDFAEMIIEDQPEQRKYITAKLERVINKDWPRRNDPINIEHVKLDGRNIILAKGKVIEVGPNQVIIRRHFRHTDRKLKINDYYPEKVSMARDEGDFAVTKAVAGSPTLVTQYYSRTGRLKGTYVNINTGIEIYPANGNSLSRIRYIDLEIDVVSLPEKGNVRIIDQHLLKKAVQRDFISADMAQKARARAEAVYQKLLNQQVES